MKRSRTWLALSVASVGLAAAFYGAALAGVRLNDSPSAPRGIWLMTADQVPPVGGTYIAACLPDEWAAFAAARNYTKVRGECPDRHEALVKRVVAIPGDTVTVDERGMSVNGSLIPNSRAREQDDLGRPLRGVEFGTYDTRPGQIWVVNQLENSFDSRYYGPLPVSSIYRTARPWLTL